MVTVIFLLQVTSKVVISDPITSCKTLNNGQAFWGNIVLVERGDCMFVGKQSFTHKLTINVRLNVNTQ